MRLATELVPTYAAILGPRLLSPFWIVLFYFSFVLFGLGQQLALCHTIVSGLIAIRPDHFLEFESALTFISCLLGKLYKNDKKYIGAQRLINLGIPVLV